MIELLRPTRAKLRVVSLAVAVFALFELIQIAPTAVALLVAALIGFALSPLSARQEVVYQFETVRIVERAAKRRAAASEPVSAYVAAAEPDETVDDMETRIAKLAKELYREHKHVMSQETAAIIARQHIMSQSGEIQQEAIAV